MTAACPDAPPSGESPVKTVDQFPRAVREIENQWIELADGARLAARIWLPEDALTRKVPAILEYIPYRKRDGTVVRDALTHPYFAGHGYACLRVDMRGNGESDGVMLDEYALQEQEDALAVIAWAAAQPWCTGSVGMMGISWGGFNGLQVAARRPPALKAIITLCSTDDRYSDDIHFKGGCVINENLGWGGTMLAYSSRPPDPLLVGDRWRAMWLERLEAEPFLAAEWLRHPHRDAYWKHGSVAEDFSAIEAAVLAIGGWNDAYSNAVPRLLAGLRSPVKAIIGPWAHAYPHFAIPGPQIGFLQEALRWWDFWLKGEPTGVLRDPAVRYYVLDSIKPDNLPMTWPGRWREDSFWPGPGIEHHVLHLTAEGLRTAKAPPQSLVVSSPQTIGLDGGEFCVIWLGPEFPGDQTRDDQDSLTFDTGVLSEPIEIIGAPEIELECASDRPVAFLAARLNDVRPDGSVSRITYTIKNLCHRDSHEFPSALEPGRRYRIRLKLDDIAWHLPKGHKVRLALSTSYWPMMWPAPEVAEITVFTPASRLILPLRRPGENERRTQLPEPVAAPALALEPIREPANRREVVADPQTGRVRLDIVDDFGCYRNGEHGMIAGSIGREIHEITPGDPLSARMTTHWTEELARDDGPWAGWRVRTETTSEMTATQKHFRLKARIEAYEGDQLVFARDFDEEIPRDLN
jgi:putative CocE/NonD family hydrolase